MDDEVNSDFKSNNKPLFKKFTDKIIQRFTFIKYIVLMPSTAMLPFNQSKYLEPSDDISGILNNMNFVDTPTADEVFGEGLPEIQ